MPFKVIIAGSRDYNDYETLSSACDRMLANKSGVEIVCGECRGADALGERYAKSKGYPVKAFPADWNKYGNPAGPIRNAEMAKYADALIAFRNLGVSKGTDGMIALMKAAAKPYRVIRKSK